MVDIPPHGTRRHPFNGHGGATPAFRPKAPLNHPTQKYYGAHRHTSNLYCDT
eukprot:SAG11_NODE_16263_length_552_cov_30.185430_1_plen_51_part_10